VFSLLTEVLLQKGVSVTPPQRYAERFLKKVDEIIDFDSDKFNDEFVVQLEDFTASKSDVNNLPTAGGVALNDR
jgi:hypothetical protein